MKRIFACFTLAAAFAIASSPASADLVRTGPLTIEAPAPIGEFTFFPESNYLSGYLTAIAGNGNTGSGPDYRIGTITFAFDLDPGWSLGEIRMGSTFDYGTSQAHENANDWAIAYFQQIILCPSSSPVDCTQGTTRSLKVGLPPVPSDMLNPTAVAKPGTGVYHYGIYALNGAFNTVGGYGGYDVQLIPPEAVPEPSTFLMIGSGAFGLIGLVKRRNA